MHFLAVWNPLYAADAMEQHLALLQDLAEQHARKQIGDEDLYVWWGRVRSTNRQGPLPHFDRLKALADGAFEDETPLYLTDYRSLYIGDVRQLLTADRLPAGEEAHTPSYYRELHCDCWFKLTDIRRLVADDLLAVGHELSKLQNTGYHNRPVSLYGGIVDLPLICSREDGATFFDEEDRDAVTDGALWAEFDRERGGGIAGMEKELRENRFGEDAWFALEPVVRLFIANAERLWRDHSSDPHFDYAPVVTSLGKAMEVQANHMLRCATMRLPESVRRVNLGGNPIDVAARGRTLSLGDLSKVINFTRELRDGLLARLHNGKWFTETLPPVLADLAELRNAGAHSRRVAREDARKIRDRLIGVGCKGELLELAACRPR